jgi:putative sterol carrier protein
MADTAAFFSDYLPKKLAANPELAKINKVFQFNINGAGNWTMDAGASTVTEGVHAKPDCVITVDKATWEGILDKPGDAVKAVMMGKLKVSNIGLAQQLQKILA